VRSSRAHSLRESPGRERVRYFSRQLITADDLTTEQEHFREKLRRHNRLLHGWGVVCGLEVTADPKPDAPWRVHVSEGYALGPYGDEIYVAESVCLDLARCGPQSDPDPCEPTVSRPRPSAADLTLYVAIRYVDCPTRPVRVSPSGCGCEEAVCEYTRIRDSFEINCLIEAPVSDEDTQSLCTLVSGKQIPICPPCPDEPWVVLAKISLPESLRTPLEDEVIDNWSDRRLLFSSAAIQEQLINCCCEAAVPVKVESVTPADGHRFSAGSGGEKPQSVTITFDKDLRKETVKDDSILVHLSKDNGATSTRVIGKVSYTESTRTAVFTPDDPFPASSGGWDYIYTVTAKGNGPKRIRDVDGLALDGDKNGVPGGDFKSKFLMTQSA